MRTASLVLTALLLLLAASTVQAAAPAWTLDVGPGYITTSPAVDEDRVYLRTSGFWTGDDRPEVFAVGHGGEVLWKDANPNATQHDMAPLMLVDAGEGGCGTWPDLVLVGWTDGTFEARERSSGRVLWSVATEVDVWGITGAAASDGDHVVVPTRSGMGRYCFADGAVDFHVETGLGWRNGVSVGDGAFWVGDESGRLWSVSPNGTANQVATFPGSLRHAPVLLGDLMLLHAQTPEASALMEYNITAKSLRNVAFLGPSPALPLVHSGGAVFADSNGLTSVRCDVQCTAVSSLPGRVNGEMAWASPTVFHAPVNAPNQGWLTVLMNETGALARGVPVNSSIDGYGTAAPAAFNGRLYLGNDAGVLVALDAAEPSQTPVEGEEEHLVFALALVLAFAGVALMASKGELGWAWRTLSLVYLILAVALLPALGASWTVQWSSSTEPEKTAERDPAWPDAWLGTQVVVFELPDETLVVGGLVGHATVLSATQRAAEEMGVPVTLDNTAIGTYLTSINGTLASGWEYTLDGHRGTLAVDEAPMQSDAVLVWRLA